MTFYEIVFGGLFLGVVSSVLSSLWAVVVSLQAETAFEWVHVTRLALACTLAVLIVSDVIFTSQSFEYDQTTYRRSMKMLDLCGFSLLLVAAVWINPVADIFFHPPGRADRSPATKELTTWVEETCWVVYLVLGLYMLVIWLWNQAAGHHRQLLEALPHPRGKHALDRGRLSGCMSWLALRMEGSATFVLQSVAMFFKRRGPGKAFEGTTGKVAWMILVQPAMALAYFVGALSLWQFELDPVRATIACLLGLVTGFYFMEFKTSQSDALWGTSRRKHPKCEHCGR